MAQSSKLTKTYVSFSNLKASGNLKGPVLPARPLPDGQQPAFSDCRALFVCLSPPQSHLSLILTGEIANIGLARCRAGSVVSSACSSGRVQAASLRRDDPKPCFYTIPGNNNVFPRRLSPINSLPSHAHGVEVDMLSAVHRLSDHRVYRCTGAKRSNA